METCDLTKLDEPFSPAEIEWRIGRCGESQQGIWAVALAYVDARAVRARLDHVCGKIGWKIEQPVPVHSDGKLVGFMVGISIFDGQQWITKWDGADVTETEAFKGGLSSAVRRAAAAHGIGAYLYGLGEEYCEVSATKQSGWHYAKTKDGKAFYWLPPRLPDWALPGGSSSQPEQAQAQSPQSTPEAPRERQRASKKPPCPECGKIDFVLEDRDVPGKFFCWKNEAKQKYGCGHKWEAATTEHSPADKLAGAALLAAQTMDKAVKAVDLELLDKVKARIVDRVTEGLISVTDAAALDLKYIECRKMIASAKTHSEWEAEAKKRAFQEEAGQRF